MYRVARAAVAATVILVALSCSPRETVAQWKDCHSSGGVWGHSGSCGHPGSGDGGRWGGGHSGGGGSSRPDQSSSPRTPSYPRAETRHWWWPHVVANGSGAWRAADGYEWVDPDDPNDFHVRWVPNRYSRLYPHIVSSQEEGNSHPADGYVWLNTVQGDFTVYWAGPNRRSQWYPHVISANEENTWLPDDGYGWVNDPPVPGDFRVKWRPNVFSRLFPHIISAEQEGNWHPQDGYVWAVYPPTRIEDWRVVWTPGTLARGVHEQAATGENTWFPEEGYEWTDINNRCWGCVRRRLIGAPHPLYQHVVISGFDGQGRVVYLPEDGWAWNTPGRVGPTQPAARGTPSRTYEHVLATGNGNWYPDVGFTWLEPQEHWTPATRYRTISLVEYDTVTSQLRQDNFAAAEAAARQLLGKYPNWTQGWYLLSRSLNGQGKYYQ